jgi:hypothetical protein
VGHRRRGMNGGSVSILFTSSAASTVLAILIRIRERHNYRSIQVLSWYGRKKAAFQSCVWGKTLYICATDKQRREKNGENGKKMRFFAKLLPLTLLAKTRRERVSRVNRISRHHQLLSRHIVFSRLVYNMVSPWCRGSPPMYQNRTSGTLN